MQYKGGSTFSSLFSYYTRNYISLLEFDCVHGEVFSKLISNCCVQTSTTSF